MMTRAAALATIKAAVAVLEVTDGDTEPAPVRVRLVKAASGQRHRVIEIEGVKGWFSLEQCNLDQTTVRVIPNLADVVEADDMCGHCLPLNTEALAAEAEHLPNPDADDGTDSDVGGVPI